jgi:hypothetical protein
MGATRDGGRGFIGDVMGDLLHIYTFTENDIDFPLQASRPATPTGSLLQAIS